MCSLFYLALRRDRSNFERPFTPKNQGSFQNPSVKTRFRRSPTFHFSTPTIKIDDFFWVGKSVFRYFDLVFEELRPNRPQNQILRQILIQIHLSWGLYDLSGAFFRRVFFRRFFSGAFFPALFFRRFLFPALFFRRFFPALFFGRVWRVSLRRLQNPVLKFLTAISLNQRRRFDANANYHNICVTFL